MCCISDFLQIVLGFLGPIVAIIIAICASRSSSRECSKKIAAIEESTAKQIESLKKLNKLQAEIATINLDKELWEAHFRLHEFSGKTGDVLKDNRATRENVNNDDLDGMTEEERARYHYYNKQLSNLEGHVRRLDAVKEELGLI